MTEPDVALTDYALALECALLTWLLYRGGRRPGTLQQLFAIFFTAAGISALAGGTMHGFFPDENSIAGSVPWRLALLALGGSTFATWSIGARLIFSQSTARIVQAIAGLAFAAYAIVVLAIDQQFWIAIVNYTPAILFLGIAFVVLYRRTPHRSYLAGLLGVLLTVAAAIVQRLHIGIYSWRVSHNALYHVIQMTALGLFFLAGRQVIFAPATARR